MSELHIGRIMAADWLQYVGTFGEFDPIRDLILSMYPPHRVPDSDHTHPDARPDLHTHASDGPEDSQ